MAGGLAHSRRLTRVLLSPAEWSVAEKCALVLGIYLGFALWALASGTYFLAHPSHATYLAPGPLASEVRVLAVQSGLTALLLVWALCWRRHSVAAERLLVTATAAVCALHILHGAYAYGTQTRLYTAAAICGSVPVAAVLFDRMVVRLWVCAVMGGLTLLTIGEVTGAIHYAPLLASMPVISELEASWMLGPGGISLAILYVSVGLTYAVVVSWQERGVRLIEAARRVSAAEELAAVIDAVDDGIVVLGTDRRVLSANQAFLRRTGGTRETVVGHPCETPVSGLECATECATRECLATDEACTQLVERGGPDGEAVWEEVHASPVRDASGRVKHVVEVWRDVTKRRHTEAKMADAHRLASLGLLASGFSHELNTPLATVLTCVESILRTANAGGDGPPEVWARIARTASTAREQLLRCRSSTQHFLRLASGRGPEAESVDVDASVRQVVQLAAPTAEAHGVAIRIERVSGGARVRGNVSDLEHVVLNLVLNAIRASPPGGTVRLTCGVNGPISIRVSDDGPGIRAEDHARIFEPFCSLRPGGTGLGLFVALSFVHRWGGEIRLESVPGVGATFEVIWPAVEATGVVQRSA